MVEGRVARILSKTELVLNVGEEQSVKEGMEFVVYEVGEQVIDPESEEELGPLETVKGRVKVWHVMPRTSRARSLTYLASVPPMGETFLRLSRSVTGARTETRRRQLMVREEDIQPPKAVSEIRVGDWVKSV